MIWAKSLPGNRADATTHSKPTQAELEQHHWAMGIERGTGDCQSYERAKRFINGLNVDAHTRDRLIRWVIEYIRI